MMPGLRRVGGLLIPYRGTLAVHAVAAVVAAVLEGLLIALLIPTFRVMFDVRTVESLSLAERWLDWLVELVSAAGPTVTAVVWLILGTVIIKNIASYVAGVSRVRVEEAATQDLRRQMFSHIQSIDADYLHRMRGGQLSARMAVDVEDVKTVINAGLTALTGNVLLVGVYLIMLIMLSPRLAMVLLVAAPLIAVFTRPLYRAVRRAAEKAAEHRGDLTTLFTESAAGFRTIRMHGAEQTETQRFDRAAQGRTTQQVKAESIALLTHPVSELFAGVLFAVLLLIGTAWTASGTTALRPEVFVAFLAVALRMLPAVKRLAYFPATIEGALAGVRRVFGVIDTPVKVATGGRQFTGLRDAIELRDVSFGYDGGETIVHNVSFTIGRGEIIGIVGRSGSGKSTILDLLTRFRDPTGGAIWIDGVPLGEWDVKSYREQVGMVVQDAMTFNRTVRENISMGRHATDGDILIAAQHAGAHRVIENLPQGLDTALGERGTRLSGGERQRIGLARALLHDPDILILDEATSALDAEADALIHDAINDAARGRTVVVVAHRVASVAHADRIVVLDAGRVVDIGTHGELLDRCVEYQRMAEPAPV